MEIKGTGLVLEGGGMRGVYTSGVLQFFMEHDLWFDYVIGVSMGACNAANYISRQSERNRRVNIDYVNDRRYLSYARLLLKGELFGMHFIFNTIPNSIDLFDYKTFWSNNAKCITVVTECISGESLYFEKNEAGGDYMKILQASSSLPFISKPVPYKGKVLMDGGMTDSIPVQKSIADGNSKNVIILTQTKEYRKRPEPLARFAKIRYPQFPGLWKALHDRHTNYNSALLQIEKMENEGSAFVIRPQQVHSTGRIETDRKKLNAVYLQGYNDAAKNYESLCSFLE